MAIPNLIAEGKHFLVQTSHSFTFKRPSKLVWENLVRAIVAGSRISDKDKSYLYTLRNWTKVCVIAVVIQREYNLAVLHHSFHILVQINLTLIFPNKTARLKKSRTQQRHFAVVASV